MAAVLFDYPLVFWTLRGMEVGALTVFVYALLWLALENEDNWSFGKTVAMGALTAMALLIRSDGVVPVGSHLPLLVPLHEAAMGGWVLAAVIGVFVLSAVGGQTVFRKHTFHETLPNTYFLKLYHIPASHRIKRGAFVALEVLTMHLAVPVSAVLASVRLLGFGKAFWKDQTKRRLVLLAALFGAQVGYATYVGGDAWEWMLYANRYMCVGMPALIILVAAVISKVLDADAAWKRDFTTKLSFYIFEMGIALVLLNLYARKFPEQGIAATMTFSKKAFGIGGALVFVGVLMRLKDLREGIPEGLEEIRRRLASRKTVVWAALILTAVIWLPAHALPFGGWLAQNAAQYKDEANYTRIGLLIRETTPESLRLAVAAAGATPYYARRPTEDLLGKNDAHIAKLEPKGVFSPGHDKWDYQWSLGERKADLIVETVDVNEKDDAYIESLGFEKMPNEMRLRKDAPVGPKERELVGRLMPDGATLAAALAENGKTLPPTGGVDYAVVFAFALVALFIAFRTVKDDESFDSLSPDAPPPPDLSQDPGVLAAEAGCKAHGIPTLDGMRGIAVIMVLWFHFAWTFPGEDPAAATDLVSKVAVRIHAFLWSGWTGVDLFFVLSGYLITRGLVSPSGRALGDRMKKFWMRRVLRIFPLYYAVLIVGSIVALVIHDYIPTIPYWVYLQNYALAFDKPGPDDLKWVAHFWSLAIEEQFYFVWPIVALTVSRRKLIPLIGVLVALVFVVRAVVVFKGMALPGISSLFENEEYVKKFVYRATFTRADGLLMGAFVAVTQREALHPVARLWRRLRFPIFVSSALALIGLYVLANGLNDYDRRVMAIGYLVLSFFFASAISMCADGIVSDRVKAFLSSRPLVACGKVSYGMYIFHWPLLAFLAPRLEKLQVGMSVGMQMLVTGGVIVGGIVGIYVCAVLSFRFFETPFLGLKNKFHE